MQHTLEIKYSSATGTITNTISQTAEEIVEMDAAIASDASDAVVNFGLTIAQVKAVYIGCDQELVVKTYNGATLKQTLNMDPGIPFFWIARPANLTQNDIISGQRYYVGEDEASNPLTDDFTSIKVTNSSNPATAATLKIRALIDPTP